MALRRERNVGEYRQALEEIHAESARTTELIQDLLTLARADAGKAALEHRDIDLVPLVQGAKLAQAKSLSFQTELPEAPVLTRGDAASLRRLLLILIDNAVKYTFSQSRLRRFRSWTLNRQVDCRSPWRQHSSA